MAQRKNTPRSDGRLQSKVYIGDGKYKYVYASTQKELASKLTELKIRLGQGVDVSAERDTFGVWAERWLAKKQGKISAGRYQVYQYRIKGLTALAYIPMSQITVADMQDAVDSHAAEGNALKTLKEYKSVLNQICQYALLNRVITFNPAVGIELIAGDYDDSNDRRSLTDTEQSWICAPTNHRAHTPAMIMMYAGLRRGELLALTWADIDLQSRKIKVNKAVEMINHVPHVKPRTKTKAGMRTVSIPVVLADYLRTAKQQATSLLVAPNTKGEVMSDYAWRSLWDSYLKELNYKFGDFADLAVTDPKTGKLVPFTRPSSIYAPIKIPMVIPHFTAHWLRHTYISMLYMAGVDVVTACKQAGHSDIKTTMDIYTHLDDIYKDTQTSKLDDFIAQRHALGDGCQMGVNSQ